MLLCGCYEGIDQRFIDRHVSHEISLGDFVLSGGELAAATVLTPWPGWDARRADRCLARAGQFSRMACWTVPTTAGPEALDDTMGGLAVPEVLLSGHHVNIERWRREQSLHHLGAAPRADRSRLPDGRLSRKDEISWTNSRPRKAIIAGF